MKTKQYQFLSVTLFFCISIYFLSCENDSYKASTALRLSSQQNSTISKKNNSEKIEVKTFEVKDSTGRSHGWGYDIFVGSTKTIHQPIIPAVSGNRSFKTMDDAMKTGLFAVDKMIKTGSLPTLLVKELDSLGVTK